MWELAAEASASEPSAAAPPTAAPKQETEVSDPNGFAAAAASSQLGRMREAVRQASEEAPKSKPRVA